MRAQASVPQLLHADEAAEHFGDALRPRKKKKQKKREHLKMSQAGILRRHHEPPRFVRPSPPVLGPLSSKPGKSNVAVVLEMKQNTVREGFIYTRTVTDNQSN